MPFTDVKVGADDVIGEVGQGDDLQRMWFTEERIGIAARCIGAMQRLHHRDHRVGRSTASRAARGSSTTRASPSRSPTPPPTPPPDA